MRRCSGAEAGISAELSTFGPLKPLKFHMPRTITLTLSPKQAADRKVYTEIAARRAGVPPADVALVRILKRSVDARGRSVRVNLTLELYADGDGPAPEVRFDYPDVSHAEEVVIVGGGPAGLFCALRLIESGYRPVILERGREVSVRRRDVAELNRNGRLDPDSNYAFGEGGAGTFSDGKLFTRSKKRGDYSKALRTLVFHGADEAILYEAHPHIGTDRLPGIMTAIRRTITSCGGEVRFGSRVTELLLHGDAVAGVVCGGERIEARSVVLATGHSADDVYAMLYRQGVLLQAKPFAMGVRVEHPQALIDEIQYHGAGREYLPAASYTLTAQVGGRGVYSFCMCPGGIIVPAMTDPSESVVNGMSSSGRNSRWANSGIVTEVRLTDFEHLRGEWGELAGLKFRRDFEQAARRAGGSAQVAPAQRLTDFVADRRSADLPATSYVPGTVPSRFSEWMPEFIGGALREGFAVFGRRMHGFLTDGAQVVGVESRTSSPVRIPRDPVTLMHVSVRGLYPAAEGAGYAGGIISAALDGERIAEAIVRNLG